ncbi:MAG TPA: hypothetical protein VN844_19815 [Pyrinomonadaceae bacterium]|nr:hypothetical protein [Pyrinomonadaceae bacterium]
MTDSEELVYRLCTKSFVSLWSYPNPRGKKGNELCDILVVCEPDIIIFSVKEIAFKDTGDKVGWERWQRSAIEESCSQIAGAERWIEANPNVITKAGKPGLPFPAEPVVHRVAVALGSQGKVPMTFGDFGKGFVHVFDEESLSTLMEELDTISDFVNYLGDKESFYRAGKLTLFDSGGEEDLLALYLVCDRQFPEEPDLIVLEDGLWDHFNSDPAVLSRKKLNEISYYWDEIIEELYQTYLDSNLITDLPHTSDKLPDLEKAIRVMARENRFSRRLLSISLVDFLRNSQERRSKARVSDSPLLDARYVFLISDYDSNRKANLGELLGRCVVARGLNQTKTKIIGLGVEFSKQVEGSATTACYLEIDDWTDEWQQQMDYQQREFGYFTKPQVKGLSEHEYPEGAANRG